MLKNAYFLAKIGADTAENELQFAEILPKFCRSAVVSPRAVSRVSRGPYRQRRVARGPSRPGFLHRRRRPLDEDEIPGSY